MAIYKKPYKKSNRKTKPKSKPKSNYKIQRPISGNFFSLKCRIPFTLIRSNFQVNPDNSLQFNFVNAPWNPLDQTTVNRFYHPDFVAIQNLYQQYKLGKIEYCIRRPKVFWNQNQSQGGDLIVNNTVPFGTQVLHSTQMIAADSVSNIIQGSVNMTPRVLLRVPTSWDEAIDNQDKRFHAHGYKTYVKRTWLPATRFEKSWRSTVTGTEQDIACGGLTIMLKNKNLVPGHNEEAELTQVLFEGYADVYMNYCRRT